MKDGRFWKLTPRTALAFLAVTAYAGGELAPPDGFENGFDGWSRWGRNANLITLESGRAHSGTNAARIQHGHNALHFTCPMSPGRAYALRFYYRLAGGNPAGQVALSFSRKDSGFRSAGFKTFKIAPARETNSASWAEFRELFMPTPTTTSCQVSFSAGDESTLWLDDVSLIEVARPAGLGEPPDPWAGLKRRTPNPLFKELLDDRPGHYTVVCWSHDLNVQNKTDSQTSVTNAAASWEQEVQTIFKKAGEAGMGFLDLPGRLDGKVRSRTAEFHREQFRKHGVRYDVWTEGSGSVTAALKNGAELPNPAAKALGRRPSVSWVDPKYVEAQEKILRELGGRLRGEPFVGYYYGKDEPTIHLPEGPPARWGEYGQVMAKEVREKYGFGRLAPPVANDKDFENDPNRPLRWIAYNRWANDRFIESRCRLAQALHEADPGARYSPADYWFMSGFLAYDYSRLAACSDLMELDPYASSGERSRGRGVFNHGFGAKFMSDLTGKPVRIVAQAFDYAGYEMNPDDLREWVSQAMRCGASAIDYYTLDRPRATHPDRWMMMLHLSKVITRMNRIRRPDKADTAILYTLYTHMSHGKNTSGDQVYAAHALVGELAGSWFQFVSDAQLERGGQKLDGFKVVYLPLAKYVMPEVIRQVEDYVRAGGVLVCGEAEAFSFDLAGNDLRAVGQHILGVKTLGRKNAAEILLKSDQWHLPVGSRLKLFDVRLWDETSAGRARAIEVTDKAATVLGVYPDGDPAIVSRQLGKGRVITFAANPFAPQVTVDASLWPAAIKGLQQSLGCKTDQPIWRFVIPAPPTQAALPQSK